MPDLLDLPCTIPFVAMALIEMDVRKVWKEKTESNNQGGRLSIYI